MSKPHFQKEFHWLDYVLFVATLMVSLGIGIFQAFSGGRQKTTKEYLLGNRNLSTFPVAVSMFMSYISAILVLGNTAEMYTRGVEYWLSFIGASIGYTISVFLFVPLLFPLKVTSAYEYIEKRYKSKALRMLAVLLNILTQVIYMGLAMFAPATALEAACGVPVWASILASGIVATIYTSMGGMKAVIWTDVFQGLVMLSGCIAVLIVGSIKVGGMGEIWHVAEEWNRTTLFNFNPNPFIRLNFWTLIVGRAVSTIGMLGTNQSAVQRYCSLPSLRKAQLSVFLNGPLLAIASTITCLCGLTVFAYYTNEGCDPLRMGWVKSNQLLPFFIMNVVNSPGLPGVFLAVLFSGALSSLSSSLNSLAAVAWKDLLEKRTLFKKLREEQKALVTKILVIFFGGLAVGMAFVAQQLSGHLLQAAQTLVGGVAAPVTGIFMLGCLFPWSNWKGAMIGALTSFGFCMWLNIGQYSNEVYKGMLPTPVHNCSINITANETVPPIITDNTDVFIMYRVSFLLIPVLTLVVCIVVGLLASLITGPTHPKDVEPKYLMPVFDAFCCCLPEKIRTKCWCGVNFEGVVRDPPPEEEEKITNVILETTISPLPPAYNEIYRETPTLTRRHTEGAVNPAFEYELDTFKRSEKDFTLL